MPESTTKLSSFRSCFNLHHPPSPPSHHPTSVLLRGGSNQRRRCIRSRRPQRSLRASSGQPPPVHTLLATSILGISSSHSPRSRLLVASAWSLLPASTRAVQLTLLKLARREPCCCPWMLPPSGFTCQAAAWCPQLPTPRCRTRPRAVFTVSVFCNPSHAYERFAVTRVTLCCAADAAVE